MGMFDHRAVAWAPVTRHDAKASTPAPASRWLRQAADEMEATAAFLRRGAHSQAELRAAEQSLTLALALVRRARRAGERR